MIGESQSIVNFELKERFYYLKLMDEADSYCWIDRNGDFHLMDDMELDHLQKCIRKIEKDIKAFVQTRGDGEVVKTLKPMAEEKLKELRDIFQKKSLY